MTNTAFGRNQHVNLCREENAKKLDGKYLLKYERDKHGRQVGVLIAFKDSGGNVRVGWSRCNTKLEGFNKHIGINKALKRSVHINDVSQALSGEIPRQMREELLSMQVRAERYFRVNFKPRIYA